MRINNLLVACHGLVSFVRGYELHKHLPNWTICGSHHNVHVVWYYVISCRKSKMFLLFNIIWQFLHLNADMFNMSIKLRLLVMLSKSNYRHMHSSHSHLELHWLSSCSKSKIHKPNFTLQTHN